MVKASQEDFSNGIPVKCAHGHELVATKDNLEIAPSGRNFRVICPECGSIANVAAVHVATMLGYDYGTAGEVVKQHMEATGAKPVDKAPKGKYAKKKSSDELPARTEEELDSEFVSLGIPPIKASGNRLENLKKAIESGADNLKEAVLDMDDFQDDAVDTDLQVGDEIELEYGIEDDTHMDDDARILEQGVTRRTLSQQPKPDIRSRINRPRLDEVSPTTRFPDEDDTLTMSNADVLVYVLQRHSGLDKDELEQLVGLIRIRDGDWDAITADAFLRNYGIGDGLRQNLMKNFKNKIAYRDGLKERANRLNAVLKNDNFSGPSSTQVVVGSPQMGIGGMSGMQSQQQLLQMPHQQIQARQAYDDLGVNGPALQAMLRQSGGMITPEIRAFMDKIYLDRGSAYPNQFPQSYMGAPGQSSQSGQDIATILAKNNEMLLQQVNNIVNKREQEDTETKRIRAMEDAYQKQTAQMSAMFQQTIAALKDTKQESKPDAMQEMVFKLIEHQNKIIEEKLSTQQAPQQVDETMQDRLLMTLFENMVNQNQNIGGSVAGAIESLRDDLKRSQNTLPGGLPMDPSLLNGYVEYQRAMGDITKVQLEHADKRESREVIKGVANDTVKTISEAIALAITGNTQPSTPPTTPPPQQRPLNHQTVQPRAQQPQSSVIELPPVEHPRAPEQFVNVPNDAIRDISTFPQRSYTCPGCGRSIVAPAANRYISCPLCGATADVDVNGAAIILQQNRVNAINTEETAPETEPVDVIEQDVQEYTEPISPPTTVDEDIPTETPPSEHVDVETEPTAEEKLLSMSMDDITAVVDDTLTGGGSLP